MPKSYPERDDELEAHSAILLPAIFAYCREHRIDTYRMMSLLSEFPTQVALNTLKKNDAEHVHGALTAVAAMHRKVADDLAEELGKVDGMGIYAMILEMLKKTEKPARKATIERAVRDEIAAIEAIDPDSDLAREALAKFDAQIERIFGDLDKDTSSRGAIQ